VASKTPYEIVEDGFDKGSETLVHLTQEGDYSAAAFHVNTQLPDSDDYTPSSWIAISKGDRENPILVGIRRDAFIRGCTEALEALGYSVTKNPEEYDQEITLKFRVPLFVASRESAVSFTSDEDFANLSNIADWAVEDVEVVEKKAIRSR
jgi:hypothetical protein